MKKLFSLTLLFVVCLNCLSQSQWKIDSVIGKKEMTTYVRALKMGTNEIGYFALNSRGMGRKPTYIGLWVTYHPTPMKRRKIKVTLNQ